MQPGKMDRRVTFQEVTESRSASGQVTETWSDLCRVSAQVRFDRGAEGTEGSGEQARSTQLFRIRYRSDITNKHRLTYNDATYDILSVQELGRRDGLEITAVAKVL